MILRTPPQRKRRADSEADADGDADIVVVKSGGGASAAGWTPVSDRRLVLYDRPTALVPAGAAVEPFDDMVCTYHCRQMVKSEFIVALNTAEKQVQEYQTKIDALEEQLSKSEDERMQFLDNLNYVEQELAATKGRESALQERLLKELADYQERYHNQVKKINELEVQLNKEIDSRISAESSASSAKESIKDLEGNLQRLSESSEREKKTLKKELSYMKEDLTLSASKLNAEISTLTSIGSSIWFHTLIYILCGLGQCLREKNEMELKLLNPSALPTQHAPTDDQKLIKLLQEELRNYEKEVHEARRLKSSHTNVELLKEKLLEEQGRRERAEQELSKLQEIEAKAHKLELELASCTALLRNIPDVSSYADIPQKIADLQKQALTNLNKVGEVTSRLKEFEVALEFADLSKQRAEGEATLAKERAESAAKEVKRLELMLAAISEERDKLRKEHAMESDQSGMEKMIRELESTIHEQKELISHKDTELNIMNERLNLEARKVKSLEREGDQLRSQMALLESKLGHGDYSASSTKVLRMVNTLAVDNEAKQTIEALQAELKKTKERLQAVEELKGQADAGTVVDANIAEKLAQLKNQIATLEKREERYKAVFAERISVFRKACCSLFGYKIVMNDQQQSNGIPVTRFILQSVYAQSDDEKLEFDYESGSTNIVVNDYTSQQEIAQQALTERQPQLEKKALRARAKLSRKAVVALCVTSFVAGLLVSGKVSLMSASAVDTSMDGSAKESVRVSRCGNKRKLGESHPKDLLNEVSRTHQAIQSLDKAVSTLEMELAVQRARSGSGGAGTAGASSKPPQKAFVVIGINTAFTSRKRRDSLRDTWVPRGDKLRKLEMEKGIVIRFVIGHSGGAPGGALDRALDAEEAETRDFLRLDHAEGYHELSSKTRIYFTAAVATWDADFYVKVDDDVHLNLGMLTSRLAKHRTRPRVYVGCMKSGPVLSQKGVKYHEPEYWKFGDEGNKYFRHATGQIYAISKDLAAYISINQPILHRFANEDVSLGAWLIGLEVEHVDDRSMCCATPPDCEWKKRAGNVCVASFDWSCSGVCKSVDRMRHIHKACGEGEGAVWNVAI
ncbi:Mitotic spindle checkpoint protein MAD1 [Dichanthelium oligosanthes]|uniref:Mitotic spindle checkpoint protein MAD1 n=1 Tax=Dichanthelium oligosanthes TaxID=888268 RepID=A0A1E5UM07_9POAL|nr:Mitotic spindle checkpoint protein MAD1 [Dichanthelium oligosanthes]